MGPQASQTFSTRHPHQVRQSHCSCKIIILIAQEVSWSDFQDRVQTILLMTELRPFIHSTKPSLEVRCDLSSPAAHGRHSSAGSTRRASIETGTPTRRDLPTRKRERTAASGWATITSTSSRRAGPSCGWICARCRKAMRRPGSFWRVRILRDWGIGTLRFWESHSDGYTFPISKKWTFITTLAQQEEAQSICESQAHFVCAVTGFCLKSNPCAYGWTETRVRFLGSLRNCL